MNIRYNNFIQSDWDKILYNSKVMNFAKSKKFLRSLIYSGKICTDTTPIPKFDVGQIGTTHSTNRFRELYYRRLSDYIDVYQAKFGDDWDIHFQKHWINNKEYYMIYFFRIFDKVTVTNYGRNISHDITDLAVFNTIGMKSNGDFWIPKMKGLRLSLSSKEAISGYIHSHLRSINNSGSNMSDYLQEFCTGSDSDTSMLTGLLATEFSKEQFELYLYSQDSILECESNIGTPHKRFSTIEERGVQTLQMDPREYYISNIKDYILSGESIDVNYYISDGKYFIKNDNVFHSFIKNHLIKTLIKLRWKHVLCKKGKDGNYHSYRALEEFTGISDSIEIYKDEESNTPPYIYYRGEKIEFKIHKERTKQQTKLKIEEFIVYPDLLNYIHGELQRKLQETSVAGSNIRRYYSRNNVSSYLR